MMTEELASICDGFEVGGGEREEPRMAGRFLLIVSGWMGWGETG